MRFTTYKRWQLIDPRAEAELVALVRDEVAPLYALLPGCTGIGLERLCDRPVFLATQYWESREVNQAVLDSESYAHWLKRYEPTLSRWAWMMTFIDEWACESILP